MLRLDVERLKGELAASRGVGVGPKPGQITDTAAWERLLPMPKDAVCGGPGRCGTLTCQHAGWGARSTG